MYTPLPSHSHARPPSSKPRLKAVPPPQHLTVRAASPSPPHGESGPPVYV